MQAANQIEQKGLKKVYIAAVLVSTLVGALTASIALTDKIQEKRDKLKQKRVDSTQDTEIKAIQEKLDKLANPPKGNRRKGSGDDSSDGEAKSQLVKRRRDDEGDFRDSARRSRALIEDVFEDNVRRVGQRYAMGDVITENKLQAQIIQLQQTVINVLQDALLHGRNLSDIDIQRLIAAQRNARDRSLDALQDQYERQMIDRRSGSASPPKRRLALENSSPPPERQLVLAQQPSPSLFCNYSTHLQRTTRLLTSAFAPDAAQRCPACNVAIHVDTRDLWVFSTPSTHPRDFQMDARFIVKCHTADGRFACVLCDRFADVDCLCTSVDALVRHLGGAHTAAQFASDPDFVEIHR